VNHLAGEYLRQLFCVEPGVRRLKLLFHGRSRDSRLAIFRTMQVEIFTVCDAATVSGGKLNILGSFDTIGAHSFPSNHPLCAVVSKLRFEAGEEGRHWLEMHFCDPDMRPVLKPIRQDFEIQTRGIHSQTHIHVWQHLGFHLARPGDYYFELRVDGEVKSRIPLYVVQAQPA
jgi:Family of unknown function (DUF6941)